MDPSAPKLSLTRDGAVRFGVLARPHASRTEIVEARDGALVVRLAARPVDGAANSELIATVATALGVARRDVTVVRGQASRKKEIEVRGLALKQVEALLRNVLLAQ